MIWFAIVSAVLLFGFTIFCICKFGLLSCYSAYGSRWAKIYPTVNIWTLVTLLAAFLLMPPLIEASKDSIWQFTGFFCPALITFVALTPNYKRTDVASKIHSIGAFFGGIFCVLYILLVFTHLWWMPVSYIVVGAICTLIFGKWSWNFWLEEAAFLSAYTVVFLTVAL